MNIGNKILICFTLLFSFAVLALGQQKEIKEIDVAKIELGNLQKQLWEIDDIQREQVENLRQKKMVKDEFETTKQFEARQEKLEEEIWKIQLQIIQKTGAEREEIHEQINKILATEFIGDLQIKLSQYDADNLRFIVFSKDGIAFNYLMFPIDEAKSLKETFSQAKITGTSSLLLDENNKPREYLLSVKIQANNKIYQVSNQNLSEAKAMQMLFGNYDFEKKVSQWQTYRTESEFDGENSTEKVVLAKFVAKTVLFKPYKENGVDKYILVANRVASNEDEELELSCHACSGLASIATFVKKSNYWKVETAQKHAGEIGDYGSLGELSIVKIGREKHALKFSWGDFHMGYGKTGEDFWIMQDGVMKEVLTIVTSEDNSAALADSQKDLLTYKSKIEFAPGSNSNFFDAKVTTTGKKSVQVGRKYLPKLFTKSETYTFVNGKYELVK